MKKEWSYRMNNHEIDLVTIRDTIFNDLFVLVIISF